MKLVQRDIERKKKIGTANIVEVMDHFDLLPILNFCYGSHDETPNIHSSVWKEKLTWNRHGLLRQFQPILPFPLPTRVKSQL